MQPADRRHLGGLDALRGFAALTVAIWHWHNFFVTPSTGWMQEPTSALPFYSLLRVGYTKGDWAVDLFFTISGFVFFYLYAKPIATEKVSASQFAMWRISRLYPLHFCTLMLVTALQMCYLHANGRFFIYQNDPGHFAAQLAFASSWWPGDFSFNGPIWSVSIEALLYISLFILARRGRTGPISCVAAVAVGCVVFYLHPVLGRGIVSFYPGGAAFRAFEAPTVRNLCALSVASVLALAAQWPVHGLLHAATLAAGFPVLVCMAGATDLRARWLGQISYSSYLLHFPLQLAIVTAVAYGAPRPDFSDKMTFIAFFVLLVLLSLASFRFLETPAQNWLRHRFVTYREPKAIEASARVG
jgi:peptidoglycan/LPS O-acetylase OafA/YrhL